MRISSRKVFQSSKKPAYLTDPVRFPQSAPAPIRTKRAIMLLLMTLVVPGSAQIVAGNKRLGRLALRVTLTAWLLVIAAVVVGLLKLDLLLNTMTNPVTAMMVIVVLAALAVGWAGMFLNTLKIIRPTLLAPGMRGLISAALVVLMVATSGSLGYAAYLVNSGRNAITGIFSSGPDIQPVDGHYNFLVLGGDAGPDRVGTRPDSIIVVSVDAKSGQASEISIPRNLQNAPFPTDSPMHKIYPDGYNCGDNCIIDFLYTDVTENYANLYPHSKDPGAQAMMDSTGAILGLKIQGYAMIDMAGFSDLIDALGGVKVDAGGWTPISGADLEGNGTHLPPAGWIHPGEQTLNGYQALWYSRSRQWVLEYSRSERQQCITAALLNQMDPATVLTKFDSISKAGQNIITSDLPANQIGSFVGLAVKAKGHPLRRMTLGPPDFDVNFSTYPNFTQIHQRVQALINAPEVAPASKSQAPTAAAKKAPASSVTKANTPAPAQAAPSDATPGVSTNTDATTPAPKVTAAYLQSLAVAGDDAALESLLANNGTCTPG